MSQEWKYARQTAEETHKIQIAPDVTIGAGGTTVIAGPCSAESWEQLEETAQTLVGLNIKIIRAGCFKPRTSPYKFHGLGEEGLAMLCQLRETYGLKIITEVRDSTHVDVVLEHADIVQIGAKAMWDYGILAACGKSQKPILLKRAFGARLKEFVQAAEFMLNAGNPNIILCERGIRSFAVETRFTLDLCGVAWLKKHCRLPIVLDPSHAMGARYGVPDLTRACVAMGVDGLLIEAHPQPESALSDAAQQLPLSELAALYKSMAPIAQAVGRPLQ